MAIQFKSPEPKHQFTIAKEKAALKKHFTHHKAPKPEVWKLLIATWNIANMGAQGRTEGSRKLITHIPKRFELISVQEVNEEYCAIANIVRSMGS